MMGVLPGFGGVVLIFVFCKTVWDARNADYGYGTLFGIGTVLLIGTILLVPGPPADDLVQHQVPDGSSPSGLIHPTRSRIRTASTPSPNLLAPT